MVVGSQTEPLVDIGRMGKAFVLLGAILLICYVSIYALSLWVAAEATWKPFNLWNVWRLILVMGVCVLLMAFGWLLWKRDGKSM